jgi:hypothetical protein
MERFWQVFAPESAGIIDSWDERVRDLREERLIEVDDISNASGGRILFTANVLLTSSNVAGEQRWFFDHPMVIGEDIAANEIVYGMRGLNTAIAFEKDRGTLATDVVVDCVLSVSVTHEDLIRRARKEVFRSVEAAGELEHLSVYAFTESDTQSLIEEVLVPAAGCDPSLLNIFGVNGSYGRHYSFLKAVAALWRTVMDPGIDRTFKIDLDQVFPQDQLVAETGRSALELLALGTLWGARGIDSNGERVELGMCAGALVNRSDIERGLFTPDVDLPTAPPRLPDLLLRKAVPQALSTEAEMMDRGNEGVHQRVHVTGGTSGITIDALTSFRPFTPSFIARAEDQAYLMSVLDGPQPRLRIAHMPGLIMRHDKTQVAADATSAAAIHTAVGDYERTILFSGYAHALGGVDTSWLGPFTSAYISRAPLAVALLRLMLDVIDRSQQGEISGASDLLVEGVQRIAAAYELALSPRNHLTEILASERAGWDAYYRAISILDRRPDLRETAAAIISSALVAPSSNTGSGSPGEKLARPSSQESARHDTQPIRFDSHDTEGL